MRHVKLKGFNFFSSCLCSWLQQDISCPTCRRSLTKDMGLPPNLPTTEEEHAGELNDITINRNENVNGFRNFFFFLDGRQIANWFPSFSIEVFHGRLEQDQSEINRQVLITHLIIVMIKVMIALRKKTQTMFLHAIKCLILFFWYALCKV